MILCLILYKLMKRHFARLKEFPILVRGSSHWGKGKDIKLSFYKSHNHPVLQGNERRMADHQSSIWKRTPLPVKCKIQKPRLGFIMLNQVLIKSKNCIPRYFSCIQMLMYLKTPSILSIWLLCIINNENEDAQKCLPAFPVHNLYDTTFINIKI